MCPSVVLGTTSATSLLLNIHLEPATQFLGRNINIFNLDLHGRAPVMRKYGASTNSVTQQVRHWTDHFSMLHSSQFIGGFSFTDCISSIRTQNYFVKCCLCSALHCRHTGGFPFPSRAADRALQNQVPLPGCSPAKVSIKLKLGNKELNSTWGSVKLNYITNIALCVPAQKLHY